MNGKVHWVTWFIGIFLGMSTTLGTVIGRMFNSKIKTVEAKVDKEVKDRESENQKQWTEIKEQNKVNQATNITVAGMSVTVNAIAKKLDVPVVEE